MIHESQGRLWSRTINRKIVSGGVSEKRKKAKSAWKRKEYLDH